MPRLFDAPISRPDDVAVTVILKRLRDTAASLPTPFLRAAALARVSIVFARQGDRAGTVETLRLAETALADRGGADTVRAWGEIARAWRIAGEGTESRAAQAKAVTAAAGGGKDLIQALLTARVAGREGEASKMLPQRPTLEADPLFAAYAVALARYGPAEEIDGALSRILSPELRTEMATRVTGILTMTANAALLRGDTTDARTYAAAIPNAEVRDAILLTVARDYAAARDRSGLEETLKGVRDYAIRDEVQIMQVGLLVDTYTVSQNPAALNLAREIMARMKTETARRCAEAHVLPAQARTDFTEIPGNRAKKMALSAAKVTALAGIARVRAEQEKPDEARALVREAITVLPMVADAHARDAARSPLVEALALLGEDEAARTVAENSENRVHAVTRLGRAALLARSRAAAGAGSEAEARGAEKSSFRTAEKVAQSCADREERTAAFQALAKARTKAEDRTGAGSAWREAALAAQAAANFELLLRTAAELRQTGETETAGRLFEHAVEEAVRTSDQDLRLLRIEAVGGVIGRKGSGMGSAPQKER